VLVSLCCYVVLLKLVTYMWFFVFCK
jgi:hypothetical protein